MVRIYLEGFDIEGIEKMGVYKRNEQLTEKEWSCIKCTFINNEKIWNVKCVVVVNKKKLKNYFNVTIIY